MGRPVIHVVGLGPAGADLLTSASKDLLVGGRPVWLRTGRHPAAAIVPNAPTFDHLYEQKDTFDQVYGAVVDALVGHADEHGEIVYGVPGSPAVAEDTVVRLQADPRVQVVVVPALSFADLAWARAGVDPLTAGASIIDGHRFAEQVAGRVGPFLVAQCDQPWVLAEIKLSVDDPDDELEVLVLQRLGLPDESIQAVAWNALDRIVPDHLTSLFISELPRSAAVAFGEFEQVMARLRSDCPWDAEQTHESLRAYVIEEAYEVLEAIDAAIATDAPAAWDDLRDELGDLLFQVFFHAVLADERGLFDVADVAVGINDKLRRRHPHVFGDVSVDGSDEVEANWEEIKRGEKLGKGDGADGGARPSRLDGIPLALPALAYAAKVDKRLAGVGLSASDDSPDATEGFDDPGALLWAMVQRLRRAGHDPEMLLRDAARSRAGQFRRLEEAATSADGQLEDLSPDEVRRLWDAAGDR